MDRSVFDVPAAPAISAGRPNLYANIHKALRLCMSDTLVQLGSADPGDEAEVQAALSATRDMLELFALHLEKENRFVHPALSACRPGSADRTADDHLGHEQVIALLREQAAVLQAAPAAQRPAAADRLYRQLALFVHENLEHMDFEETHNMAVLWSACTDDEIMAIERAIVASIPPATMARYLRWMLPALPHPQRVQLLAGMREAAPPGAFEAAAAIARERLAARDWARLAEALGLVRAALAAAA